MPIFELTDACSVHIARSTLEQATQSGDSKHSNFFFLIYSEMYPAVLCVPV